MGISQVKIGFRSVTCPTAFALALAIAGSAGIARADGNTPGIEFEIGVGGQIAPRYEGASDYLISPFPTFRLQRLTLPNGFQIGGGDGMGLSFYPSFGFRGARKSTDTPVLNGLDDVDKAIELGAGVSYTTWRGKIFGEVRRGFGGHEGYVGEIGAEASFHPTDTLTLSGGPRVSFADAEYMDTYFGVSAAETKTSGLSAFDAGAGFKSVGIATSARYEITSNWAIEAEAAYDRLIGDAAASPVTGAGSRDQFSFRLGAVRKFKLDF